MVDITRSQIPFPSLSRLSRAMVDIIQGISLCEKEREELKAFMEEKKAAKQGGADGAGSVRESRVGERSGIPQDIAQTLSDDGRSR
ncbi:unnamed protein product [Closterium sp. NIES-64]|nr:unnamed protein product [Closterium sp. NIES-64]CAI5970248.1 unnamed protein product [Closterium sp. NIES-64]